LTKIGSEENSRRGAKEYYWGAETGAVKGEEGTPKRLFDSARSKKQKGKGKIRRRRKICGTGGKVKRQLPRQ